MPFRYFGAKKRLARYYDPPRFPTIIEPFAGSAGYALYHAKRDDKVILIEKDERIAELWWRLQTMTVKELFALRCPAVGERCYEPLILLTQASNAILSAKNGLTNLATTTRMVAEWPSSRGAIARALPKIRTWTVICGDFSDAPDTEATWFIDPPYSGDAGRAYPGWNTLNFTELGDWCLERQGQTIVCEKQGAQWLPFRPFRHTQTTNGCGDAVEVVWTSDPPLTLFAA